MINQTRTLLVAALLVVAYLLWQQWQHDYPATPPPQPPAASAVSSAAPGLPQASTVGVPEVPGSSAGVPEAPSSSAAPASAASAAAARVPERKGSLSATPTKDLVTVSNDVLRLTIDPRGGTIVAADLLDYPQKVKPHSPPVRLLDGAAAGYYVAQNGLVGAEGSAAPSHLAEFTPTAKRYSFSPGQKQVVVTLNWHDPISGVSVAKRYTLTRGSYVVVLAQQIDNHGSKTWHGNAYEQLDRIEPPPPPKHLLEFYNPDTFAYTGAAWYSPDSKFNKLKFGDFESDPLHQSVTGGWIAMSQRFFLSAWISPAKRADSFSSVEIPASTADGKPRYLIRSMGPTLSVAPGASSTSNASLYVGPMLQDELGNIAPGLNLTIDYGMFTVIAAPMFKLLSFLHTLVGTWGLAIIVLVLIIQAATYKLTEAQYKASARMRKLQPRLKALKERFGDDKQK